MKWLATGFLTLFLTAQASPAPAGVFSLIQSGRIDDALDSITDLGSTFAERGNVLFYRGLIEADADSSARLLEAARENKVDSAYQDVIAGRLAFYYLMKGNGERAVQEAMHYLLLRPQGQDAGAMSRIVLLVREQEGKVEEAALSIDSFLAQHARGEDRQWGLIDKARTAAVAVDNSPEVPKVLKKLAEERSGPGVATAMVMLVKKAIAAKQFDDAVRYFGLLKEEFPYAVGLSSLADQLGDIPEEEFKDAQAEKATGTYYAVKVGVFSQKSNADQQAERCRLPGQPTVIDTKQISRKTYYIVYVGRFPRFADAEQLKSKLENQLNDSFQVVAR